MCGGFSCSKNALIALNVLYVVSYIVFFSSYAAYDPFFPLYLPSIRQLQYALTDCLFRYILQLVGFLLIGVGVYGRAASIVTNLPIIGGILACGIILILISILGLVGAVKHHQVMLFFVSFLIIPL